MKKHTYTAGPLLLSCSQQGMHTSSLCRVALQSMERHQLRVATTMAGWRPPARSPRMALFGSASGMKRSAGNMD